MAICRITTLVFQKPRILSSFFLERWFGTSVVADGLSPSFSTHSVSTIKPEVIDAPLKNPDEKPKLLQDQVSPKNCRDIFNAWGFNKEETTQILVRMPSLNKTNIDKLEAKLRVLNGLGFKSSDLVTICRPRFLSCKINHCLNGRVQYLKKLFGSRQALQKAILRNPFLLTYNLETMIKPTVDLYKSMGITGNDLRRVFLTRPNIIPRASLNAEKLEYIRRTGSQDSKMYKYVVTIMGIMRVETVREKIANLEKFGLSEDEVLRLFGSYPVVLSLSTGKVRRNMTYVVECLKRPASIVLGNPFLLYNNLETMIKPRMIVARKIDDMGLVPRIDEPKVFTALRMTEKRFTDAFINCHPPEIAKELMECFLYAKHVKLNS